MQDDSRQVATSDYPASFIGADKAASAAQATHMRLQQVYLITLVLTAVVSLTASLTGPQAKLCLYGTSAVLLMIGLLVLWIQRAQRYDKVWFDCRAAAESIKTITWRFMMSAPPFDSSGDHSQADALFIQHLNEILRTRSGIQRQCTSQTPAGGLEITNRMHLIRDLPLNERIAVYRDQRLADQESWYCSKMSSHARSASFCFWIVVVLQALALFAAVVHLAASYTTFWSVPVLVTVAAALTAWSQTRRYDELSFAYSVAAQELRLLRTVAINVTAEDDFRQLVEQVEEAVSREHTMWCARREVKLPGTDGASKKG